RRGSCGRVEGEQHGEKGNQGQEKHREDPSSAVLREPYAGLIWQDRPVRGALRLGIVMVLAGCTQVSKTDEPRRSVLRVGQLFPVRRLSQILPEEGFGAEGAYLVFDRLVFRNAEGQPVGGLVEKWQPLDGGRRFVLTLRAGLKFHDGARITSDD